MRLILSIYLVFNLGHSYGQIDSIVGHFYYSYPGGAFVNTYIKLNPDGKYIIRHRTDFITADTKMVFEGNWELVNDSIQLLPDRECLSFNDLLQIDTVESTSGKTEVLLTNNYGVSGNQQLFILDGERSFEFISDSTGLIMLQEEFTENARYFLMGRSSDKISRIQTGAKNVIFVDRKNLCKEELFFGFTNKKIPIGAFFKNWDEVNDNGIYRFVRSPDRKERK